MLLLQYFITSLSLLLTHVTPTVMRSMSMYIYIQIRVDVKHGINMQIWQWFTAAGRLAFLCLQTAGVVLNMRNSGRERKELEQTGS